MIISGPFQHKIAIWHKNPETRELCATELLKHSMEVVSQGVDGVAMVSWVTKNEVDLIICGESLQGLDGASALLQISEFKATPGILISPAESLASIQKLLADHVMSYLCEPIRPLEIIPNVLLVMRRFSQMQRLKSELNALRETMSDAKYCYLAKYEIMRNENLCELDAHQRLQRMATDNRIKLVDAAKRILAAKELTPG